MSASELADRCGTTESTALRRLRALKRSGVISGPVMRVAPEKVGRGVVVILSIRLERETPAVLDAFRKRLAGHPDITHCYFVTGSWDYVIILTVSDMAEYNRFLTEMVVGQKAVVATDTHVVLLPMKTGAPVPIDEPAGAGR